jgi:hypothetical protein
VDQKSKVHKVCTIELKFILGYNFVNQRFFREALVWRQLIHPRILPFLGVDRDGFESTGSLSMISPWIKQGTLMDYLVRGIGPVKAHKTLASDEFSIDHQLIWVYLTRLLMSPLDSAIYMPRHWHMGTFTE